MITPKHLDRRDLLPATIRPIPQDRVQQVKVLIEHGAARDHLHQVDRQMNRITHSLGLMRIPELNLLGILELGHSGGHRLVANRLRVPNLRD